MWFPLTTVAVSVCLVWARALERRGPITFGLYAYAFALIVGSPLFFKYPTVDYSPLADGFTAACVVSVTLGYRIIRKPAEQRKTPYPRRHREVMVSKALGLSGIFGSALLLLDSGVSVLNPGTILANASQVREDQFAAVASAADRGPLGTIGGFLAPLGVTAILAAVWFRRDRDRGLRGIALANVVLLALVSFGVFAGRATITNAVLLAILGVILTTPRFRLRIGPVMLGVAGLAVIWFLATSFFGTRTDNVAPDRILERTQRAQVQDWLRPAQTSSNAVSLALVSLGYFASPNATFHFYLANPSNVPGPYYGGYSNPLPARLVGTIAGTWTRETWLGYRQEIFSPIDSRGYPPNVWTTWFRDLLVDWGYGGAIVFCALFGGFVAWARNKRERTGAMHYFLFEVIGAFTFGFGAFTSFMFDPFLAIPFFTAFPLMLVMRLHIQPAAAAANPSQPGVERAS